MEYLVLDISLALILCAIAVYTTYIRYYTNLKKYSDWRFIAWGTYCLAFASLVDITDNLHSFDKFIILGDTLYQAYLKTVLGYLLGCFLIGLGIWRLIPQILYVDQSEKALRESEERFREFAELLPQFVFELDTHGRVTFANQQGIAAIQYNPDKFPWDQPALFLVEPKDQHKAAALLQRVLAGERLTGEELCLRNRDGSIIPIAVYANPVIHNNKVTGVRGVGIDITNMKQANEQIAKSLQEKEILLREIHHRVKNNLQIMSSLLALQARRLPEEPYGHVFQEARNRIWSMALVHESLHRSSSLSEIPAADYIQRLTQEIHASFRFQGNSAAYELDIEDISIRLNTSITCGLIINELVSNCIKHAFPPGTKGKIKVSLHSNGDNELELTVRDNGVGLQENIDMENPQTFGFFLVNTLVDALQGNLDVSVEKGTVFRIRFEDEFSKPDR